MSAAALPTPLWSNGGGPPFVPWGSMPAGAYAGQSSGSVRDLIGWGDSAPLPLRLSAVERCAMEWWGGWCEFAGGITLDLNALVKAKDGTWSGHPPPICWASKPLYLVYVPAGQQFPTVAQPGTIDHATDSAPATAARIVQWGVTCPPALRLTHLENEVFASGGGWAQITGKDGLYVQNLIETRFGKLPDGTWTDYNDPNSVLGYVTGVGQKPKHGVAGLIDAFESDISKDPLGAILLLVVLISAGPAIPAVLGALEAAATVTAVAGAAQYAATGSSGIIHGGEKAAGWVVTHPSEIGRVAAGTELAIAGAALGGKLGGAIAGAGAGLLASGLGEALAPPSDLPNGQPKPPSADLKKYWWNAWR